MAVKMRGYVMAGVGALRFEPSLRRVRVLHEGQTLCDTTAAALVWEPRRIVPLYAVPERDLQVEPVAAGAAVTREPEGLPPVLGPERFEPHTTPGQPLDLRVDGQLVRGAAFRLDDPDLAGFVLLDFRRFEWLEEEERAVGHPHDPFKRIDTFRSSRHVVVSLGGTVLADSRRPVALLETHLPVRWYLPRDDVRMDLLEPSEHRTTCAYKGHAAYYSVPAAGDAGRDVAWTYAQPLREAQAVRDMICFFSERTDLTVDGEAVARPVTPWSAQQDQQRLFDRTGDPASLEFG